MFHDKTYDVNAHGFLMNPSEWDEAFATHKAEELGVSMPMTELHWKIIRFLRESFERTNRVPTVFETSKECGVGLEDLERLFPTGFHRGAVKVAGLHVL
jgi:tRNA 2-thiouridine synthesizing protein E